MYVCLIEKLISGTVSMTANESSETKLLHLHWTCIYDYNYCCFLGI